MNYTLDKDLISRFRDKVNSNSYFILYKYGNIENKNRWNIICSCMDWISVAVRTVNVPKLDMNNLDSKTMEVYSYISTIDIIHEAIKQLHRVLINNKTIPFQNQKKIFKDNKLCKDDNSYFKQVRAIFGAHPVNIDNIDGKRFASWPYQSDTDDFDLQVSLYSNELEKDDILFGIKFKEIDEFLFHHYSYLQKLIDEMDKQFNEFCLIKKNQLIPRIDNPLEQLKILTIESKSRLNNDYYTDIIDSLKILFNTQLNSSLKEFEVKYKNQLIKVLNEVINNLQNMKIIDLKTSKIISPDYHSELFYELSKLLSCLLENNYDHLLNYYIKQINLKSTGEILLDKNDTNEELYLKVKILMYYKMWI